LLKPPFGLPPAIIALLLQVAAFFYVGTVTYAFTLKPSLLIFAGACGLIAAGLSYIAKLDRWWLLIQGLFAPALAGSHTLNIHPNFFLAAFFMMLLVFWNTFRTQVPLYLSSNKVWIALEDYLPQAKPGASFTFVDIGSGLGGVLTHLAKARPDGIYCGIESAPLPFLWSWLRVRLGAYHQCQVQWGDLWGCELSHYDVVFAYLSPAPMERLWHKAQAEMRPGTVFISSTFAVPGEIPVETVVVDDLHRSALLVWWM
jgi:hypothetical protein